MGRESSSRPVISGESGQNVGHGAGKDGCSEAYGETTRMRRTPSGDHASIRRTGVLLLRGPRSASFRHQPHGQKLERALLLSHRRARGRRGRLVVVDGPFIRWRAGSSRRWLRSPSGGSRYGGADGRTKAHGAGRWMGDARGLAGNGGSCWGVGGPRPVDRGCGSSRSQVARLGGSLEGPPR